jgi:hypothetical protein
MSYCNILSHKSSYNYACPKCINICSKRKEPFKDGSWCDCECKHNTYWCTICSKPVEIMDYMYYYVYKENQK